MRCRSLLVIMIFATIAPILAQGETVAQSSHPVGSNMPSPFEQTMALLNGVQARTPGPNCWNAALAAVGLTSAPRAVTKPEFWHWLNSPFCRRLKPSERPKRGDIGSLFWKHWGNYHSYVHLDGHSVFAKEGPDPEDVYRFQKFEDMFRPNYKAMATKCRNLTSQETLQRTDCEFKTVYHRCRPLPAGFIRRHSELRDSVERYNKAEEVLQAWILSQDPSLRQKVDAAVVELGRLISELRQRQYKGELEFARKSLEWAAIGLISSDLFVSFSPEAQAAEKLADQIQLNERAHIPLSPEK